jgi:hypothetical protein
MTHHHNRSNLMPFVATIIFGFAIGAIFFT